LTNTPDYTDTVAKASAAYPASNPSNFIMEVGTVSHTNLTDVNGVGGRATLDGGGESHLADHNDQ